MKPSDFAAADRRIQPDYPSLINNVLLRKGTPNRVHFLEMFLDDKVQDAVDLFFGISAALDRNDPLFPERRFVEIHRRLGYECLPGFIWGLLLTCNWRNLADTAEESQRRPSRSWLDGSGPIQSWEDFEKYPWPDVNQPSYEALDRLLQVLPDDMCLFGCDLSYLEPLCWLFGYEPLCYALADQPDLVAAVVGRIDVVMSALSDYLMQVPQIRFMFAGDDMGFKTGLMVSPDHIRRFALPGHKKLAARWHAAGKPYILHCCGKRSDILEDLIEDVKIDGIHSFEDTIEPVTDAKRHYGQRLSLIGGIDVDFLCRSTESAIRRRVRETIEICQPGGGWALGTGNSVANYIPLENYLIMLDEGRK